VRYPRSRGGAQRGGDRTAITTTWGEDAESRTFLKFGTPGPYRLVRHPLYVGWPDRHPVRGARSPSRGARRPLGRIGTAAFAVFLVKGLVWLAIAGEALWR
jgi:hypothetical protein